jgi:hypothetical protein
MTEERSHVKVFIIISLVIFLAGMFLGYYIWSYQRQKAPDYKEMLRQTITYITTMEEQNQEMAKEMSSLKNDMANLKKQQDIPENDQLTRLNERVAVLEKENTDLKAKATQNEALAQENQQLRQKVQALVEEMNSSRPPKASGSVPVQGPGTSGISGQQ